MMINSFLAVFKILNTQIFLFSALLFFVGYAFAPTAYYKKIKWLISYPLYIARILENLSKKKISIWKIFFVIILVNSISLFINLLSGFGIILPFLFNIYMGINIGVIVYHQFKDINYYLSLINPVAMIELPAAWICFTLAIQYSIGLNWPTEAFPFVPFTKLIHYFLNTIIPLLIIAGIIETALIKLSQKISQK